jgi:nicotinamidase-related amidase
MKLLMDLLRDAIPLKIETVDLSGKKAGLVDIDTTRGFCEPKCGNLAPREKDPVIESVVGQINTIAGRFVMRGLPIRAYFDCHKSDALEFMQFPPHGIEGSGEEELMPELARLKNYPYATIVPKNCINAVVADLDGLVRWVNENGIEALVVAGLCTDICITDFVCSAMSARNLALMPTLKEIVVFTRGCATYNLPKIAAMNAGMLGYAAHPRELTHYMGLYMMASRGAKLAFHIKL